MTNDFLQVIHREATVMSNGDFEQPFKVTLNKKNKKNGECNIFVSRCVNVVWYVITSA